MKKLVISAPQRQHDFLNRLAKESGLPKAEVMRRILDEAIKNHKEEPTNEQAS